MLETIRLQHRSAVQHHCRAEHTSAQLIVEKASDGTIWRGTVYFFDVVDHPEAKRCYAWVEIINGTPNCTTIMKLPLMTSAQTAVREVLRRRAQSGV